MQRPPVSAPLRRLCGARCGHRPGRGAPRRCGPPRCTRRPGSPAPGPNPSGAPGRGGVCPAFPNQPQGTGFRPYVSAGYGTYNTASGSVGFLANNGPLKMTLQAGGRRHMCTDHLEQPPDEPFRRPVGHAETAARAQHAHHPAGGAGVLRGEHPAQGRQPGRRGTVPEAAVPRAACIA